MPSTFELVLKNGKCFINRELKSVDVGISKGIIKNIGEIKKESAEKVLDL